MKTLIILESPGKIKTVKSILGPNYDVMASFGHVEILERTGKYNLGIDVDNGFKPSYKVDPKKKDVVKKIRNAAKLADVIMLACDADREGEAIAASLKRVLRGHTKKIKRITFNEITDKAVKNAIKNPRTIDTDMVNAQETRRILDRIIGFRLSGLTLSKLGAHSAGRVQSAALRILSELEKKIKKFNSKKYFELYLPFKKGKKEYKAMYKGTAKKNVKNFATKADANKVIKDCKGKDFIVGEITKKNRFINPKLPYTTSSFQQEMSSKLGYGPKRSMKVAQSLYEGINIQGTHYGLITYMRTDSTRLSDDFIKDAKAKITKDYGKEYLGSFAGAGGAQDAHEGIRPSYLKFTPAYLKPFLSNEEFRVYELIYSRSLASIMKKAKVEDTEVIIHNGNHRFTIKGMVVIFDGFLGVYKEYSEDKDLKKLPAFKLKEKLTALPLVIEEKDTKPPRRYSEASLVKAMEKLGIGRPSTFAATIETLKKRDYIEVAKKSITVTDKGLKVNDMLVEHFNDIINTEYTSTMEGTLDKISEGTAKKLEELTKFYDEFQPLMLTAAREINKQKKKPELTDKECPKCKAKLVIRKGRYGDFYACSRFPHCRHTEKKLAEGEVPKPPVKTTGNKCPECNVGELVERVAKKGKSAGSKFYACNKFPKCKTTLTEEEYAVKFKKKFFEDKFSDNDLD